jgi:hypothetical protein
VFSCPKGKEIQPSEIAIVTEFSGIDGELEVLSNKMQTEEEGDSLMI